MWKQRLGKNRPAEFIFAIKVYLSLDGSASVSEGTYVPCIPRALLALLSPVIREKVRSTIRFSPRKSEQNPRSQLRGIALVLDKVKYRSDAGPSFPPAFPLLTLASNYNVTSRRRRRLGCDDENDAGWRFIALGILPRYFLAESGFPGKTAAGNFFPLWNTALSESSSTKSVQGSRAARSLSFPPCTKGVYAESLALGGEMRVRRGPREKWMKNIVLDTMAPNPWRDNPGVVADALHDAEGKIGH